MEKTLEATPCSLGDALPYLAKVTSAKADTMGGLATIQDICARSQIFRVACEGHTVGAYAVEPQEWDRGTCLFITAAQGQLDGVDLSATMPHVFEAQARQIGAKQIGLMTRRRGLVRALQAKGWTVAGIKLIKKL